MCSWSAKHTTKVINWATERYAKSIFTVIRWLNMMKSNEHNFSLQDMLKMCFWALLLLPGFTSPEWDWKWFHNKPMLQRKLYSCKHNKPASKPQKGLIWKNHVRRKTRIIMEEMWLWVFLYVGCSQNEKPHLRLMRHRLDKDRGRHLFSIQFQDVNNVPPSKQSGDNPWGNTIILSATHNIFY